MPTPTTPAQYPTTEAVGHVEQSSRHTRHLVQMQQANSDPESQSLSRYINSRIPSYPAAIIATFLAPIIIVVSITSSQGDEWKLAFVVFFFSWLLAICVWLFLDLRGRDPSIKKWRWFWHLISGIVTLAVFVWLLGITSEHLPEWIPLLLDMGLGTSIGLQDMTARDRRNSYHYLGTFAGSLCGCSPNFSERRSRESSTHGSLSPRHERRISLDSETA